jgi:hypothetical protein
MCEKKLNEIGIIQMFPFTWQEFVVKGQISDT